MRFGIIGLQHSVHLDVVLNGLRTNPFLQLAGIAEPNPSQREYWGAALAVPAYVSWEELIEREKIEAAAVVCAYNERAAIASGCLERGVHVLCDKPVAIEWSQVAALERACRVSGAHFTCLLEKRFWGTYRKLKQLIDSGHLGEIVSAVATGPHKLNPASRPAWMFQRETYGGTLVDLAIHDLDALLWLCGGTPTVLRATERQRRWHDCGDLADSAQVYFQTDRGLTAFVDVNWLTPTAAPWHGDYRLLLNGTHGAAAVRYVARELIVTTDADGVLPLEIPDDINPVTDFAEALRLGRPPSIPPADVFRATRLTLLARAAADRNEEVVWEGVA